MTTIGRRTGPAAPQPNEPVAPAPVPAPTRELDRSVGRLRGTEDTFGASSRELEGRQNSWAGAIGSVLPTHTLATDAFERGGAVARVGRPDDDVQASALEARVGGQYVATVGANGVRAEAAGAVEATVAQGSARVGLGSDAAGVRVGAQAYAGARLEGRAGLTIDPSTGAYNASVRQEVFVGARAGVNGRAALGALGAAEGRVEVQAGIGASLEGRVGYANGRLRFGAEVGVAFGVGARVRGSAEVNVQPVIDAGRAVARGATRAGEAVAEGAAAIRDGAAAVGNGAVRLYQLSRTVIRG